MGGVTAIQRKNFIFTAPLQTTQWSIKPQQTIKSTHYFQNEEFLSCSFWGYSDPELVVLAIL